MSQSAVIYCRAASVVDGDNQQVQAQEELCRAYAQSKGYSVENVFVDKGVSGSTLERPQFKTWLSF